MADEARARAEAAASAIARDADLELRAARLAAERERLDDLLAALETRLARSREHDPNHRAMTEHLVEEALACLPQAAVLRIDPRDEPIIAPMSRDRALAIDPSLTTWGGVVACAEDRRRVDNTLEARLRARRDDLLVLIGLSLDEAEREAETPEGGK